MRSNRFTKLFSVLTAMCGASLPALADLPAVLDRVPAGAAGVVAIRDIESLDDRTGQLLTAVELTTISSFSQTLNVLGLRDGLNMDGSAGAVLFQPGANAEAGATPGYVLLIPVTDAGAMRRNLRAEDDGGIYTFDYAQQTYFLRELDGGYVCAGADRALVADYDARPGQMARFKATLGGRCAEIASESDVVAIGEAERLSTLLQWMMGPLLEGAPPLPGLEDDEDPRVGLIDALVEGVANEGEVGVAGFRFSPLGIQIDAGATFVEGSAMRAMCSGRAGPAPPITELPNETYLFLGSVDLSHDGVQSLLTRGLGEAGDAVPLLDAGLMRAAMQSATSASVAVYAPPALMIGAVSRTLIVWHSEEPGVGAEAFRTWIERLNEKEEYQAVYNAGAGGVDSWSVVPMSPSPASLVLYGPDGLLGSVAVGHDRGAISLGRDTTLLEAAMDTEQTLGNDIMLSQVASLLPEDRVIEWYLDARPIFKQLRSFMQMGGRQAPELPAMLPPIGSGVVMSGGELHGRIFIPAPLIQVGLGMTDLFPGGAGSDDR